MVTYLVGTDGEAASGALVEHLRGILDPGDHVEAVHVMTSHAVDDRTAGEAALAVFEGAFDADVSVTTRQLARGRSPSAELVAHADDIGADTLVTALRRHSRTERIIVGSVSHALLQRVTRPLILVPLAEYGGA